MSKVLVYTIRGCPFCRHAKKLLDSKGVNYEEIDVTDLQKKREAKEKFDWPTLPIILINEELIGGYDELRALERENKLDELLSS
ncbi:MAG TPA: glutaredoxin domain-containing protein [Thermodesulfobacteriota bacterium]|nr:glutaredoxin domain-containing protein [Thermodesulfobacteriota bacterium]